MTRSHSNNLADELTQAGATTDEAKVLTIVARQLARSPRPTRSPAVAAQTLESILAQPRQLGWVGWVARHAFSVSLAGVLALIGAPFALAQTSLPGDRLYGLKRASETAATVVIPGIKQVLPVRRSAEVKQLIEQNEHRDQVEPTLEAVTGDVEDHRNEVIREQTKHNLERAKEEATESEKQAIEQTIRVIDRQQENTDSSEAVSEQDAAERASDDESIDSGRDANSEDNVRSGTESDESSDGQDSEDEESGDHD